MASTKVPPVDTPAAGTTGGGGKSNGVARAAMIMVAATLMSRVIGMVRDMVIAYQFSLTAQTDTYVAAFKIPDLMTYLIAGGALSSTFIPVFTEYLKNNNERGAWKTFSIVATVTAIVATLFVMIAELFAPQLVLLMNPGYRGHPDQIALAAHLTRIIVPAQIFFMLGGLLMGTLNTRGQFLIPSLGPSIYNLGIIGGALAAPLFHHKIECLMWGALAGAFLGNFALQLVFVKRVGMRYRPNIAVLYPGAVKVWKMMLPIVLGVSLPNVDQIINSYFASNLMHGAQTAMQYANRLMLIPIGVFAQAMAIAIFPTMAAHAAAKNRKELRRTINKGLRIILFLTIPSSVLFFILAVPIISVLFQHGKFTFGNTLLTASPLRYYSIGIFAWAAQAILTRGFYAIQDSRTPVISGTITTVLFILMNEAVITYGGGVSGLALATTIAAIIHTVVLLSILSRRLRGIGRGRLIISITKTCLATGAMAIVCWSIRTTLESWLRGGTILSPADALILVIAAGTAGIGAFLIVARGLRMSELQSCFDMLKRKPRLRIT